MYIAILLLVSRVGDREYALQCHGEGFNILDVTDPASIFRVQFVAMSGGGYWRDVATHTDSVSGKTYAYVGSQGTQGGGKSPNLFVFDLSYLSGDINNPNGVDSDPIPQGNNGWLDLGYTDLTHTINVARGLLFLNTGRSSTGCQVSFNFILFMLPFAYITCSFRKLISL